MRRNNNIRRPPQGVVLWQRLRIRHVQRCPAKLVRLQRFHQGGLVDDAAAGDVDEQGLFSGEDFELLCGNEVLCLFTVIKWSQ